MKVIGKKKYPVKSLYIYYKQLVNYWKLTYNIGCQEKILDLFYVS